MTQLLLKHWTHLLILESLNILSNVLTAESKSYYHLVDPSYAHEQTIFSENRSRTQYIERISELFLFSIAENIEESTAELTGLRAKQKTWFDIQVLGFPQLKIYSLAHLRVKKLRTTKRLKRAEKASWNCSNFNLKF